MNDIMLNISLNIAKKAIVDYEIREANNKLQKAKIIPYNFIVDVNSVLSRIYSCKTFQELEFVVMEDNDMTLKEAKDYISRLIVEENVMYN